MIWLTKEDVIFLHSKLIEKTHGIDGIRDHGMLDSALNAPLQTFDGQDIYKDAVNKIIRLSYCLVCNHPFIDGNKRIAALIFNVLFQLNSFEIDLTNAEEIDLFLSLASGKIDFNSFKQYVIARVKKTK